MPLNDAAAVIAAFPHPVLTPIIGKPNFTTLRRLQKELYANACVITTELGGGAFGHLGIVIPEVAYLELTGAQISDANRLHKEERLSILQRK